jgi:hypothetical protein
VFDELSAALDIELVQLRRTYDTDLPKLNAILKRNGLDEIRLKPAPPKTVF